MHFASPAPAQVADTSALDASVARIDADLVALKANVEHSSKTGVTQVNLDLAGTISWPGFGKQGENWFGFLFRIRTWTGTPRTANDEGSLHWVAVADVLAGRVPMWESDRHFLPLIFAPYPKPFHGVMPFAQGRAVSWSFTQV